jgi:hypothetical protein
MTISRMQQPRQMYGLGSLVKSITKGVKEVVKSPLGKAAALYFAPALIPGGAKTLGGVFQNMGGLGGLKNFVLGTAATNPTMFGSPSASTPGIFGKAMNAFSNMGPMGKFATTFGIGALGGGALQALEAAGLDTNNPNEMPGDVESLKSYLKQGYLQLNPDKTSQDAEAFAEANTTEYRADGGRIGFADGMLSFEEAKAMNPGMFSAEVETDVVRPNTELLNYIKRIRDAVKKGIIPMDFAMDLIKQKTMEQGVDLQGLRDDIMETQRIEQAYGGRMGYNEGTDFQKWLEGKQKFEQSQNAEQLYREYLEDKRRQKVAEQKTMAANGGRIGYAFGNPEQNAINAAGIMNLPLNQNPAGVTELDLRETGGFIPPVGVKEKADDIPAMLSNNEFVFTAKSVKEMGDGDVNKGAQRMYDMMKKLEGGGRV